MNKRYCCRTENCAAANTTAGYQYTWQGAQQPVPTLGADYRLRRGCCAAAATAAAVWVTAARFSVTLSRALMTCSTAIDNVLNCCRCTQLLGTKQNGLKALMTMMFDVCGECGWIGVHARGGGDGTETKDNMKRF